MLIGSINKCGIYWDLIVYIKFVLFLFYFKNVVIDDIYEKKLKIVLKVIILLIKF